MTSEQRKKASIDLTLTYCRSYYQDWRLAKVLTIKKLMDNRYDFYSDIIPELKPCSVEEAESTIAQEIKNGLCHDAIAQCIQYIEDLFALINATKKPDFFVKNIITYKAGTITASIKTYKSNVKNITRDFYIPSDMTFATDADKKQIADGVDKLVDLVNDQVEFYKKYWFFYNQYKHGLAVPMRPFGNTYHAAQVEDDKQGKMNPYIVAYDNMNIKAAQSKGTHLQGQPIMINGFTDNVRPHIGKLEEENNYLRLVYPDEKSEFSKQVFVDQAFKTRACINTLMTNYTSYINPEEGKMVFQVPDDYRLNQTLVCTMLVEN